MSAINKFVNHCKKEGFSVAMRKATLKVLGLNKQQEEIDTLYYFLNTFFEPSQLGPTKDEDLRIMQLCDADLLAVLDKVFEKHGLDYWLDWGTLLGAVRHKGFIPWDDDTDIAMPRKDYEKALEILPKELSKYGIIAKEDDNYPMHRMGVGYMHSKTGVWVDIFPVDEYYTDEPMEQCEDDLKKRIAKYKSYYRKNHTNSVEVLKEMKKNILRGGVEKQCNEKLFYHCPEFFKIIRIFKAERIYPLQRIPFEEYILKAPAKLDEYLTMLYGTHYMQFPKGGTEHHDLGRGPLKTWAKRNGVNMNEVRKHLQGIEI